MSQVLINRYLTELTNLRDVGGNRSGLEWVLDQYKEKVIDLLGRVTTVSVETMKVVELMKRAPR